LKTKNSFLLVLFGIIALSFSACEKSNDKKTATITYGYSFGQANSYQLLQLNENLFLYEHESAAFKINKRCSKAADSDAFADIMTRVDLKKFRNLPNTIGCPDCADGGAEFVEIKADGEIHRVTYNYGKVPEELAEIVIKLKPVMESFKDCQP
jgi:hypothetical protein